MIENRELTMDDYMAMLRRRLKVILIPTLLAPIIGFGVSFVFQPKYTSTATVLVEPQKVPEGVVKPAITVDISQRIATIQQQVLSRNQLEPMIDRLGLVRRGRNVDEAIDQIRQGLQVQAVQPTVASTVKKKPGDPNQIPGFNVSYTAADPNEAQRVCNEITSMMIAEDLKERGDVASGTTGFIDRQLDEAKRGLDEQDAKLAAFKKQFLGQLPGDEDNNMKLLAGLNSQLDANTQTLNRAEQDKTYAESLLAQQVAAWKASSQTSTSPQTLQQQLVTLQTQLSSLQARYTDDYPDVVKTKNDITAVQRQLKAANAAAATASTESTDKTGQTEPPEIQQLRVQIHQYGDAISQATRDQKRLQQQIAIYQSRVSLSPGVEEQYKVLTRDYDTAQKFYQDLLAKRSESEMQTNMERGQQGEQMRLLNPASLPDSPSFPNRLLFAAGGAGAGLAVGGIVALGLELKDKSIRTEQDVLAALELPVLVSMPWVGNENSDGSKNGKLNRRGAKSDEKREMVEV